jgi:hypothetical protein
VYAVCKSCGEVSESILSYRKQRLTHMLIANIYFKSRLKCSVVLVRTETTYL